MNSSRVTSLLKYILVIVFFCTFLFVPNSVQALNVTVNIPEKYTEVIAGDRAYFTIELKYPENPSRKDLKLEYQIKKDGEVIAESKVLKAVETQASFIDYIVIPDNAKSGMYTVSVKIADYESLNQEVTTTFKVVEKTNPFQMYFFIIVGAIAILGVIITIEIYNLRKYLK